MLRRMTTYPMSPEDREIQERTRRFVDEELIPWEEHAEEHDGYVRRYLETGEARTLFQTRVIGWEPVSQGCQYAVTADGQRFLISTETDAVRSITLVLNWPAIKGS